MHALQPCDHTNKSEFL